jgi:enoyl-[acyl-carrier protein] reductase II
LKTLNDLWKRGKDFLGVEIPIMCGAMTWISESGLVSTVSNAGAFGCLAGGNMEPHQLSEEIDKTKLKTNKPFALNLITIAPNYKYHLPVAIEKKVPFIIFAGGIPKASDIQMAKEGGSKVMAFASTESIANRLIRYGIDGLMLEGSEAGGHIGHVTLAILLQQVLFSINQVPVFVAGGIGTGRLIPHLLLMGAAGVQLGTLFVCTEECNTHPDFKKAFLKARARDAIATPQVGSELHVVAVRALRNKGMHTFSELQMDLIQKQKKEEINQEEAQFAVERYWVGALRNAVKDGDIHQGSLMAGQSVGLVDRIMPIKELLDTLIKEAREELKGIWNRLT